MKHRPHARPRLAELCLKLLAWMTWRQPAYGRFRVDTPVRERWLERNLRRKIRRQAGKMPNPLFN